MTIQDDFQAAANQYAARLTADAEKERLAAHAVEARHANATTEGAEVLRGLFDEVDAANNPDIDTEEPTA